MTKIAFVDNKGGIDRSWLVYHLAWMYAEMGRRVLAVDLDPQAYLSSMFLDERKLTDLWTDGEHRRTVIGALKWKIRGSDPEEVHLEPIDSNVDLAVGDFGLSAFEDEFGAAWRSCQEGDSNGFRAISSFHSLIRSATERSQAEVVLIDVGPNLGAINRAILIASDWVITPLTPDLFSMEGLRNLGPAIRKWKQEWQEFAQRNPNRDMPLAIGNMNPAGYVFMQYSARANRAWKAAQPWIPRIPLEYREWVAGDRDEVRMDDDPNCLGQLKQYRSLMEMGIEARKPIFQLKPADGAIGAHTYAVLECTKDFRRLADQIARRCGMSIAAGAESSRNLV